MVKVATEFEIALSEATGKGLLSIRFYAARLLLELKLGRQLTPREAQRIVSKVVNSFPRVGKKPRLVGDEPEPNHLGAREVLLIIERSKILEARL